MCVAVLYILVLAPNSKGENVLVWFQKAIRGDNFLSELLKIRGTGGTPFFPQAPMHFALPTSGGHLACAVLKFTGIPSVAANPFARYRGPILASPWHRHRNKYKPP